MCECRVFAQAKREYSNAGVHYSLTTNFQCLICNTSTFDVHGDDGDYAGFTYECANCRNYLIYSTDSDYKNLFKDEFYFLEKIYSTERQEIIIIRHRDKFIIEMNEKTFELPLFKFENKDGLIYKIKTYLLYQ